MQNTLFITILRYLITYIWYKIKFSSFLARFLKILLKIIQVKMESNGNSFYAKYRAKFWIVDIRIFSPFLKVFYIICAKHLTFKSEKCISRSFRPFTGGKLCWNDIWTKTNMKQSSLIADYAWNENGKCYYKKSSKISVYKYLL